MHSKIIKRHLKPIVGKPCWGVWLGYGSYLALNFGKPSLDVRNPKKLENTSSRIKKIFARRHVSVWGEWTISFECCDWLVYHGAKYIGGTQSKKSMLKGIREIDGQTIESVEVFLKERVCVFRFDIGGLLKIKIGRASCRERV